jgi:hypothetical protein
MPAPTLASTKATRSLSTMGAVRIRSAKTATAVTKRMKKTIMRGSFYELAHKYIGAVEGPGDLSARSKTMEGYGLSRRS